MGNYKLSPAAEDDLFDIYRWGVRQHGEAAADEYYFKLFERFKELSIDPKLYSQVNHIEHGYRRSVCGVHSIYYRIAAEDTVEIIAIIGRQNIKERL